LTETLHDQTVASLRSYVNKTLLLGQEIADDEELLVSGLLDSLAVMSLVTFIEETFNVTVPFTDVVVENFESVQAIGQYISGRVSLAAAEA
jgi:acyl carrier protein